MSLIENVIENFFNNDDYKNFVCIFHFINRPRLEVVSSNSRNELYFLDEVIYRISFVHNIKTCEEYKNFRKEWFSNGNRKSIVIKRNLQTKWTYWNIYGDIIFEM